MAAILGLNDVQVETLCRKAANNEIVAPANYNAPNQIVVAGHAPAVERTIEGAKNAKAKRVIKLAVSVPSHCDLMRPAEERLNTHLDAVTLNQPNMPVIHNVDGCSRHESATIRTALKEQLYRPVRWVQCVENMVSEGAKLIIECGPGKVLTGLNKRIAKDLTHICVHDGKSLDEALTASAY
jgi:[acyl-carrier-protein] S-malonyltransferase